jgi:hypothetical protein
MANFLEALRTRVKAIAPDLTEVYLSSSDTQAVFPYVIISKLWEDTIETSIEGEDYKEVRLQFTLFSFSDVQAESLGKQVYKGLKSRSSMLDFTDGYEMGRSPGRFIGPTDVMDQSVDDQNVWRTMFDFTWNIGQNEDD